MPNDEARALIDLIIPELQEMAVILAQVRDGHLDEAGRRIGESIAACAAAPIIRIDPPKPEPSPLTSSCEGLRSVSAVAIVRAVEQLHGAQALGIRRLCELYEQASGPTPS